MTYELWFVWLPGFKVGGKDVRCIARERKVKYAETTAERKGNGYSAPHRQRENKWGMGTIVLKCQTKKAKLIACDSKIRPRSFTKACEDAGAQSSCSGEDQEAEHTPTVIVLGKVRRGHEAKQLRETMLTIINSVNLLETNAGLALCHLRNVVNKELAKVYCREAVEEKWKPHQEIVDL